MSKTNEIIQSIVKQFKLLNKTEMADAMQIVSDSINIKDFIRMPLANNGVKVVYVGDIIYLDVRRKNVFIITKEGEFPYNNQACDILDFLEDNHVNFRHINCTQVVNLDQMKTYDSYLNRVYYTDSDKVYLNCTGAAVTKKGCVKVYLGVENDRNIKEVLPRREYASSK